VVLAPPGAKLQSVGCLIHIIVRNQIAFFKSICKIAIYYGKFEVSIYTFNSKIEI